MVTPVPVTYFVPLAILQVAFSSVVVTVYSGNATALATTEMLPVTVTVLVYSVSLVRVMFTPSTVGAVVK